MDEATLEQINNALANADEIGGYCLGVVCAIAWQENRQPSASMIKLAAMLSSVEEAVEFYKRQIGNNDADPR